MLQHVWPELNYQLDVYCVTGGAHIEVSPRINLRCSTTKLFNFIELDLVVFKIIAFKIISNFFGYTVFSHAKKYSLTPGFDKIASIYLKFKYPSKYKDFILF